MASHTTQTPGTGGDDPVAEALNMAVEAAKAARDSADEAAAKAAEAVAGQSGVLATVDAFFGVMQSAVAALIPLVILGAVVRHWAFVREAFQSITGIEAMGIKIEMAGRAGLSAAVLGASEVRKTVNGQILTITRDDQDRALQRLAKAARLVEGKSILWLDDHPAQTNNESALFRTAGMIVSYAETNEAAMTALLDPAAARHDVVISDIGRDDPDKPTGAVFAKDLLDAAANAGITAPPVVYYISHIDENRPNPVGSFGLTNRPDDLVHMVVDALERRRGV